MASTNDATNKNVRAELAVLINNFLKAIPVTIDTELGLLNSIPKRKQRSSWMVQNGSGSYSESFERLVLHRDLIINNYKKMKIKDVILPEEMELRNVLERICISKAFEGSNINGGSSCATKERIISDFCFQLLSNWLRLENPFLFEEKDISNLIEESLDAILNGKIVFRQKIAIEGLDCAYLPVEICNGITIRQISREELWELGDTGNLQNNLIYLHQLYPFDRWKILEIKLSQDKINPSIRIRNLIDALLVLLRLGTSGSLEVFDLGLKFNYGSPETRRSLRFPIKISSYGKAYSIDLILIERLRSYWPKIYNIVESDNHYLRLPAIRLLDGGLRQRLDDAILDYAIGLERLLTEGTKDELSYRFALRGATILSWESGNKKIFYENFKKFYKIRSSVVHGSQKEEIKLEEAYVYGEAYLRDVVWWYLSNGFLDAKKGLTEGTRQIDNRILNN